MKDDLRNRLREGVFGLQDGLISTSGALLGIAAGTQSAPVVALSGLVIVAVESLSMAAGSYISSKSQKEYLERLLKEEEEAIARDPEGERREIWEMYRNRGFTDDEIKMVEKRLFSDKKLLLEDMAHKELGICPAVLENPASNAVVMGLAYIGGGLIPAAPYFFASIGLGVALSIAATLVALFAIGGIKGKLVGQNWGRSAAEMLGVASLAGAAGYAIGALAKRWLL